MMSLLVLNNFPRLISHHPLILYPLSPSPSPIANAELRPSEFLLLGLKMLGKVDEKELLLLLAVFKTMDTNGNGV
jgi:hypothetical protein